VSAVDDVPVRAVDWRYLLPRLSSHEFEHLTIFGGSAALAARVSQLDLARRVTLERREVRTAEVVVALPDANASLAALLGTVTDDGIAYIEVDRHSSGVGRAWTVAHVSSALVREGFAVCGVYALGPRAGHPHTFIPIHASDAITWFVRHRFEASSPAALVAERALESAAYSRRFVERMAKRFAVVAIRPPGADASVSSRTAAILDRPEIRREVGEAPLAPLILAAGGDRVVVIAFAEGGGPPALVVKIPRSPRLSGRTEHEIAQVSALRAHLDPGLRQALPEPLARATEAGITVAVERAAPGVLLARACARWGLGRGMREREAERAMEWILAFHRATERRRMPLHAEGFETLVGLPCARYREALGTTATELALFDAARRYAARVPGTLEIPIVVQHRDYTVWNIVRDGDRLSVLDWEGAREGMAGTDLVHFLVSWAMVVKRWKGDGAEARALKALWLDHGASATSRLARALVSRYLRALAMDERLFPLIVLVFAVELAARRAEQRRDAGEASPNLREGNTYVGLVESLANESHALFPPEPHARDASP
jgi:aminoglycoside phosphotransferase (APT) family kinase protein